MIVEGGKLIAFFIGLVLGYRLKGSRPKVYEIKEFRGVKK